MKYFLGLEIARSPKGIMVCLRKYTLDMLEEYGVLGANPIFTPKDYNHKLCRTIKGEIWLIQLNIHS